MDDEQAEELGSSGWWVALECFWVRFSVFLGKLG